MESEFGLARGHAGGTTPPDTDQDRAARPVARLKASTRWPGVADSNSQPDHIYENPGAVHPAEDSSWYKLLQLISDGARVLDVGCAAGSFARALRQYRRATVVGIEPNPAAATLAANHCATVFTATAEQILADGHLRDLDLFDVILFADVLEHMLDPAHVIRECASLLKPGGVILASVPNVTHSSVLLEMVRGRFPRTVEGLLDRSHVQFFGRAEVLELFHQAGCAVRIVDTVRILPQHTELQSDLSQLREAVIEFLDSNADACTYQFIVRAVPRAWATPADDTSEQSSLPANRVRDVQTAEIEALQEQLRSYHEALQAAQKTDREQEAELAGLHEKLRLYHEALETAGAQAQQRESELAALREQLGQHLEALQNAEARARQQEGGLAGLHDELRLYHEALETAGTQAQQRESELAALRKQLGQHLEALQNAEARARQWDVELSALHARLAEYHAALDTAQQQNVAHEVRYSELLRQSRQTADEFNRKLTESSAALESIRRALELEKRCAAGLRQPMERLRVLYITERLDAPYRYRCENACLQLRSDSVTADPAHLSRGDLLDMIPAYSVIVLFRLPWGGRVQQVVERARECRATLVFDIDDLLFSPDSCSQLYFLDSLGEPERGVYQQLSIGLAHTLEHCDFVIASTPAIARAAEARGKPVFVHPNLLHPDVARISRRALFLRRWLNPGPLISYLSGSNTHQPDFLLVAPVLRRILADFPEARLLIGGFVEYGDSLDGYDSRLVRLRFMDWRLLPWAQVQARVNLAPIACLNEFSNAKSALKFFKAAIAGVPTVASPTEEMRGAIESGVNGFLAETAEEWYRAIAACLDAEFSRRLGAAARQTALARYTTEAHRGELRDLFRRFIQPEWHETKRRPASQLSAEKLAGSLSPVHALRAGFERARAALGLTLRFRNPKSVVRFAAASRRTPLARGFNAQYLDPDTDAVDQLLRHAQAENAALQLVGPSEGMTQWTPGEQVSILDARAGTFQSLGNDPWLLSPQLELRAADFRFLLIQMQCPAAAHALLGQLFWLGDCNGIFHEECSVKFLIPDDGKDHTYLLDLEAGDGAPQCAWREARVVTRLRFDPTDHPGRVCLTRMVLLSPRTLHDDSLRARLRLPPVRVELSRKYLCGSGIEIGALQNPLPVPRGVQVRYVDRLTLAQARKEYPELDGTPLVKPAIIAEADRLDPIPSDSLDFCICNHVVEHLRDPLGAAREWIRVLRSGGILYLAVPDHTNPLDRHRPVTAIDHIVEDFHSRPMRLEEDRQHFLEWASSVHFGKSESEQEAVARELIDRDYAIHFHTFSRESFAAFLRQAELLTDAKTVELCSATQAEAIEHIAVLRKER